MGKPGARWHHVMLGNYELANPTPEQQKKRKEQAERDARLEKRSCC